MITRIWRHLASGELFAVAVDSYGIIVGASGPVEERDAPFYLTVGWDDEPGTAAEIRSDRASYVDVTDRYA